MKDHNLIHGTASWDLSKLPDYLASASPITADPAYLSPVNTTGSVKLNGYITKAILEISNGNKAEICVIQSAPGNYSSEWKDPVTGKYTLTAANDAGLLEVGITDGKSRYTPAPGLGNPSDNFDTTSILAPCLLILRDSANPKYAGVAALLNACADTLTKTGKLPLQEVYQLNDYLQVALATGDLQFKMPGGDIDLLYQKRVASGALNGNIICGHSDIIMPGTAAASAATMSMITVADAKKKFAAYAATRSWTPEQEARIRNFPDDHLVPEEVVEIAEWYIDSRGSLLPAVNFCWRGITGCGKSTGAALLSCILHTPLYIMTCNTNMETGDFLSTLVPETNKTAFMGSLPSIEDIWMDPEGAYKQLTGITVASIEPQQVLEAYGEVCASHSTGTSYTRVNSEYVKALECGGIVEIQEFSRIRDSGVLVGLNEYDHANAVIPLVDGSYVLRNPDAICLWTDNIGYGSCRTVDPSVMRRMSAVFDTFELDKSSVVARAIKKHNLFLNRSLASCAQFCYNYVQERRRLLCRRSDRLQTSETRPRFPSFAMQGVSRFL